MAATEESGHARLAALTAAALALPGIVLKAHAELAPLFNGVDTNFTRYEESGRRMRIDAYQATGSLTITDSFSLRVNGVKDVVSGASPVALAPRVTPSGFFNSRPSNCTGPSNGKIVQCVSGASIRDVRDAVDINLNYYQPDYVLGVDVGRSSENDYTSDFFNLDSRWDLNGKMTTIAAGYGFASDRVWEIVDRADGSKGKSPDIGGDKASHQGLIGITQILDKNSLLQANLTYTYSGGYLSDPYKYAYAPWASDPTYGTFVRDSRPGARNQMGLLVRYVRNFATLNSAALHVGYRFYSDTWGIDSHTFEASWNQPLFGNWMLTPNIRYYSQTSADFYQPFYDVERADHHYSSDYRLANFAAISGGLQLSAEFFDHLRIAAGAEWYERREDLSLTSGSGTGLDNFSFSMYSVSLNVKF